VSGWKDIDKEGGKYKDYFINAKSYFISNYKSELKGMQGYENEFFLDLTQDLKKEYVERFEVVYNHTTLEHIFEVKNAFKNLCLLSKDIVIIIVPFLQQMHGNYDDFWRFTPITIKKMYEENKLTLLYLSFNNQKNTSVYIFAIGSKYPEKWKEKIPEQFDYTCKKQKFDEFQNFIGCRAITNPFQFRFKQKILQIIRKIKNQIS